MTMDFRVYVGIGLQLLCYTQAQWQNEFIYPPSLGLFSETINREMKKALSPTVVSTNIT